MNNTKIDELINMIKSEIKQREFTVEEVQNLIINLQTCVDIRRFEFDRELFFKLN